MSNSFKITELEIKAFAIKIYKKSLLKRRINQRFIYVKYILQ